MPYSHSLKRLLTISSHYIPTIPLFKTTIFTKTAHKIKIIKVLQGYLQICPTSKKDLEAFFT